MEFAAYAVLMGDGSLNRQNRKRNTQHRNNMKTTSSLQKSTRLAGLVVALALFAGLASQSNAQTQIKGGQRLLELNGSSLTVVPGEQTPAAMSCANCQDVLVTQAVTDPKGLGARTLIAQGLATEQLARHLCGACTTKWTIEGQGKAKVAVFNHICPSCGSKAVAYGGN